jgi:hypothetical protein
VLLLIVQFPCLLVKFLFVPPPLLPFALLAAKGGDIGGSGKEQLAAQLAMLEVQLGINIY